MGRHLSDGAVSVPNTVPLLPVRRCRAQQLKGIFLRSMRVRAWCVEWRGVRAFEPEDGERNGRSSHCVKCAESIDLEAYAQVRRVSRRSSSVGSLLEYQHEIGQEQEEVNGSEQGTFVRLTANVNMLTTKVRIRRMVSTASMPRMIVEPVKNPMARTAGMVRLMLARTGTQKNVDGALQLIGWGRANCAKGFGASTSPATNTPPRVGGRARVEACDRSGRQHAPTE